jgi:3-oxoacyl-[acyl-carrier protein] reductase
LRLKDKVSIITGGANGIGFAAAKRFGQEGAKVVIVDFDEKQGLASVDKLASIDIHAMFIQVDVSIQASVKAMVSKVLERYGRIDILINNAGITRDKTIMKMTQDQWQEVIDVNLTGVFNCTQAVVPQMIDQGKGRIVNMSSVVGTSGGFGQVNYSASKAGLIGMTKSLAKELGGKGITVNAVAAGFIMTDMVKAMPENVIKSMVEKVPVGRLGEPIEVANAYLYLASDEAAFVNGTVLEIDGGIVM